MKTMALLSMISNYYFKNVSWLLVLCFFLHASGSTIRQRNVEYDGCLFSKIDDGSIGHRDGESIIGIDHRICLLETDGVPRCRNITTPSTDLDESSMFIIDLYEKKAVFLIWRPSAILKSIATKKSICSLFITAWVHLFYRCLSDLYAPRRTRSADRRHWNTILIAWPFGLQICDDNEGGNATRRFKSLSLTHKPSNGR